MIRPLRQRHRFLILALSVLVPAGFSVGIAARRGVPFAPSSPVKLGGAQNDSASLVWARTDLWGNQPSVVELRRDAAGVATMTFRFRDLVKPDVLIYWIEGIVVIGERLPDSARFLGAFVERMPVTIPSDLKSATGRLLLYSLADQEVVGASVALTL